MKKRMLSLLTAFALLLPWAALADVSGAAPGEALGYALLRRATLAQGEALISPYSLAQALSMAAQGAAGDTRGALLEALGAEAPAAPRAGIPGFTQANAVFVSDEITLLPEYLKSLERYGAASFPITETVAEAANAWVKERTLGSIPELITRAPDPLLRLLLINAVTLEAQWAKAFDPENTSQAPFHGSLGETRADFMSAAGDIQYGKRSGVQIARLPYRGEAGADELAMYVLLPRAGGMEALLDALVREGAAFFAGLDTQYVDFSMPKLNLTGGGDLSGDLRALGLEAAFAREADFSGMTGKPDLMIGQVSQKVRLRVDEDGTKAAAATQVQMVAKSALILDTPVQMRADRPFVLLVRDDAAGLTLFSASVTNL